MSKPINTFVLNNKDYIGKIASRLGINGKEAQKLTNALIAELADSLDEGNTLSIKGFGNFDVKKKLERVVVNPVSKQKMLVPPKLVLSFKPSAILKDKLK